MDRLSIATALVGAEGEKTDDHETERETDDEPESEDAHATTLRAAAPET